MSTKASSPDGSRDGSRAVWILVTPRQRLACLQAVNLPRTGTDRKAAARLRKNLRLDVLRDASDLSGGRLSTKQMVTGDVGWAVLDMTCRAFLQGVLDFAPKPEDKVQQIQPSLLDAIVELIEEFDSTEATSELADGLPLLADSIEDWAPSKYEEQLDEARAEIQRLTQLLQGKPREP